MFVLGMTGAGEQHAARGRGASTGHTSAGPAMRDDGRLPEGSRAVLIGVSAYEYAEFPPIRAARNSLDEMRSLLTDPALCGWPSGQVTVIANPLSAAGLATTIADLAEAVTGTLLLYYVGHGVLSARGELCLTVTSSRPDRPKISALPWDTVADVLRDCPARTRLAILDCCFAGQATQALAGDDDQGLADITHVEGVYTLTATTGNRTAHVPPAAQQDAACTSFTGALSQLVRSGVAGGARWLSFGDIYRELRLRLPAQGLPAPSQRGTDAARGFLFAANAAAQPAAAPPPAEPAGTLPPAEPAGTPPPAKAAGTPPPAKAAGTPPPAEAAGTREPPEPGPEPAAPPEPGPEPAAPPQPAGPPQPSRQARLVANALRTANSTADEGSKARALVAIASALAAVDPQRAARLVADAARVAESVPDAGGRGTALAVALGPLAAIDSDRAERAAYSITGDAAKAQALAAIGGALATADPERATGLIAYAAQLAESVPDVGHKASALAVVAQALAVTDSDRAERVAQSIPGAGGRALALAGIAQELATADPDRSARLIADAERVAQSISGVTMRASALAAVTRVLAATDPDRALRHTVDAERVAQTIPDASRKAATLAAVAKALAVLDSQHAERLAQSITEAGSRACALAAVAAALDPAEPGHTAQRAAG